MSGRYHPPPDAASPFRDRLLHPRWEAIESGLGRPVPGLLREIYDAPETLLRGHFYLQRPDGEIRAWLDLFLPMDEEALRRYGLALPAGAIAFADDEHGDPYFYVPDASGYGDGPVFLLNHQNGRVGDQPLAASLAEFLRWPRRYQH